MPPACSAPADQASSVADTANLDDLLERARQKKPDARARREDKTYSAVEFAIRQGLGKNA
ncbi:hypothetical protein [Streptomyces sp. GQFP]|uniref:hypothetical protein n=1 Tax=Streptomyces sp. GQFP TaxID=2907545 RepID=UPI001F337542|nr:hypothetical protein [Streptomyces sp. GQFP]UIX29740.1 hypothetical protein LUX31_06645 [Streptomyces sp. GQFP]